MKDGLSVLFFVCVVAGCGKGEQPAGVTTEASSKVAASAKAVESSAPAAPQAAPVPQVKTVQVNDFLSTVVPAACAWMDQCKNEKVKAVLTTGHVMTVALDPTTGAKGKAIWLGMPPAQHGLPDKKQCEEFGGLAMQIYGLTADSLQAKIGKTVEYNGENAAACVAVFESSLAACNTEEKLSREPNFGALTKFEKEFQAPIDAHTKVCHTVLTGLVEDGKACERDFECKGEGSKCNGGKPKAKLCKAGKVKH